MSRVVIACLLFSPCSDREKELRGWHEPSADGGTLLSVEDCVGPAAWVDGKKVKPSTPVPVKPGSHEVGCGAPYDKNLSMGVDVPRGRTYHFDYWGP